MADTSLTYYGHALFVIETASGTKIGTDPYDEKIKEPLPRVDADIVTTSHDHFDHNNVSLFGGDPIVINSPGETLAGDIRFYGIPSFHDEKDGSLRGDNLIFMITADGITFTHLGDLGHMPDKDQLQAISGTDILLIPVGGIYTIDSSRAAELIGKVKPGIAVPMHYKEEDSKLDVDKVSSFTRKVKDYKEAGHRFSISKDTLPEPTEIRVMVSA